jgi:hypothetical protein
VEQALGVHREASVKWNQQELRGTMTQLREPPPETAHSELMRQFKLWVSVQGYKDAFKRGGDFAVAFAKAVIHELLERFSNTEIMEAFRIFNPLFYPDERSEAMRWGEAELNALLEHFGTAKRVGDKLFEPFIDAEKARVEWPKLRNALWYLHKQGEITRMDDAIRRLSRVESYRNEIVELFKVAQIGMILPVSSACAERGFSCHSRIKTRLRNRLSTEVLDDLMRISLYGPPLEEIDLSDVARAYRQRADFVRLRMDRLVEPGRIVVQSESAQASLSDSTLEIGLELLPNSVEDAYIYDGI